MTACSMGYDYKLMRTEHCWQDALSLLEYVRGTNLEVVLRLLFESLAHAFSLVQSRKFVDAIRVYVMSVNPIIGEDHQRELVSEFWP